MQKVTGDSNLEDLRGISSADIVITTPVSQSRTGARARVCVCVCMCVCVCVCVLVRETNWAISQPTPIPAHLKGKMGQHDSAMERRKEIGIAIEAHATG